MSDSERIGSADRAIAASAAEPVPVSALRAAIPCAAPERHRPTVLELEAILAGEPGPIEVLPNGEIRSRAAWSPIETAPIKVECLFCWLDSGEYDAIEYGWLLDRDTFMNFNSGNARHRDPSQPHTWPSHWLLPPELPAS